MTHPTTNHFTILVSEKKNPPQLTGALRTVDRTFTTHYDLTDVDLPCPVCDGGGLPLGKWSRTMIHPTTRTTDNFMILCLNLATHALQTVVRTLMTFYDLYELLRPFTTFYDFTDVILRCLVCNGGGPHLSR